MFGTNFEMSIQTLKTKIMKRVKSFILVAMVAMTGLSVYAQDAPKKTAEERATMHTQRMKNNLELTPEQVAKVQDLNLGIAQKKDAIRTNPNWNKEQKEEALKKVDEARMEHLKTILTAEQYEKMKKHQEKIEIKKEVKKEQIEKKKEEKKDKVEDKKAKPLTEQELEEL